MSRYQDGQQQYSRQTPPAHPQYGQYGHYSSQPAYPEPRRESVDTGDDGYYFDEEQEQNHAAGVGSYPSGTLGSQYGTRERSGTATQTSIPHRSGSQVTPLTGYQHQQQNVMSPSLYNPASFPAAQPQYNSHSYASPTTPSFSTSTYQPYVPAAYQTSTVQRQSSLYNYEPSHTTRYSISSVPPPPPLHSGGSIHGQRPASYGVYQHEPQYQSPLSAPTQDYQSQYHQSPYSNPTPAPPRHDPLASATGTYNTYQPQAMQQSYHAHPRRETYQDSANQQHFSGGGANVSLTPPLQTLSQLYQGDYDSRASPRRNDTTSRHPHARPLPGPPSESESDSDYFTHPNGSQRQSGMGVDDLVDEISAQVGSRSAADRPLPQQTYMPGAPSPLNVSSSPRSGLSPDEAPTHMNGYVATTGDHNINYAAFSDDSDAEAAAGLAALQAAEEQDAAEEARRRSGSASLFQTHGSQSRDHRHQDSSLDVSSDSDYGNVDMGMLGGGYEGHLAYGESQSDYASAATMPSGELYNRVNPRTSSARSSGRSSEGRESHTSGYDSVPTYDAYDAIHPFPPFGTNARVDTGGTGGLTEPSPHPRRLSFEDGDEDIFGGSDQGRASGSASPSRDSMHSMQDLFFHPGMSPQRPLPPAPSNSDPGGRGAPLTTAGAYTSYNRFSQYDNNARPYPAAHESYQQTLLSPSAVPRSISLSSTRSVPKTEQPNRSKTDADRQKLLRAQMSGRPASDMYEGSTVSTTPLDLDLPTIPRKRFNAAKIASEQFKKCTEPWALSSILAWIKDLAEEETDLKEHAVLEGIVNLFTNKVPTMNVADAEALSERVVTAMFKEAALVREEEWVKFGPGAMSGVLYQLTGTGCYSPRLHVHHTKGRCYSHYCMRTLKKVDLSLPVGAEKKTEDWITFYKLKKEDYESMPRKEINRQNMLHEVVTSEDSYISHLDVLRVLYRDQLAAMQIIPGKKQQSFLKDVFGQVDEVKKVNEDFLLAQLKYRQIEQGPWISGFSDIFREWIRRARSVYVNYAANYPRADFLMRRELERNIHFKQFLDQAREDRRSSRLGWDSFLKEPITRIQRYVLLLTTILKETVKESEEKTKLQFAIDEVRAATFECDSKLAEMEKKTSLIELGNKIKLRKGMEREVELNLDHLGREVLIRGDLQRAGGKGFAWVDTHAILFDHYLVLAKTVTQRDSAGGRKFEYYDVSKVPIPMDLIVLESTNDDPVVKSSVKGIGAVTTAVTPRGQATSDPRLARTTSVANGAPGTLVHTTTSTSIGSGNTGQSGRGMITTTVLEGSSRDEKIMYPFRIKHLGKSEVYTLYAPSASNRQDWCDAIIEAKTRHAAGLYAQNAEPFRLRVLADTAFAYDSMTPQGPRRVNIRGTPLDRAIAEAEKSYDGQGRPTPVCRAAVNCATVFNQPYGRLMCAVGTDYGVYISEYHNPRGWTRAINLLKVTQVAVFEEFNLFLLIADKALIAYHLDVVCPPTGNTVPQINDASSRKAPQKLSGARDVGFFATGKQKDRALVFYKKRDGLNSTFKVLEPVLQKSTATRSRFLPSSARRGQTEFFREYDEFYIPAECYSINLYQSSMAISTARGVEVLTLDKKQPWSVPNLRSDQADTQAHLSSIASRIKDLRPLGMFRLGEAEFLVAFEECAVYVNKHGDVSRGVVMEFVGRAKSASLHGSYLLLIDDDFVEIRDAMNGRLKQVIAGKDIKMLDDGGGGNGGANTLPAAGLGGGANGLGLQGYGAAPRTVKLCMQHPEYERSHVLLELVENLDRKD